MSPQTLSQPSPPKIGSSRDYAAIADQYARDIAHCTHCGQLWSAHEPPKQKKKDGPSTRKCVGRKSVFEAKLLACKWVILACERQLKDLLRAAAGDDTFPYRFDAAKAAKICSFIEALPHIEGEWITPTIRLEPWQIFSLAVVFGWVHVDTGYRRFSVVYVCIPRKNGKSIIAAGVGLFMFVGDGERGAKVFAGATKEDQAWKVFEPAKRMVLKTPTLQNAFDIRVPKPEHFGSGHGAMHVLSSASRFETMIGVPGDGDNPSCSIHDEYHEHSSSKQVDAMRHGMAARKQPLQFIITTAGESIEGPCYAQQQDVEKILEGSVVHDHIFGIVYTIDSGDDWTSETAARKANPNYGVSVSPADLAKKVAEAVSSPRKQAETKTKHFNIWLNGASKWMNMEAWNACANPDLTIEDFAGDLYWEGVDLSSTKDITSRVKIFRRVGDDGEDHYFIFGQHYLPRATVDLPEKKHYRDWEAEEYLTVTDGPVVNYRRIEQDIVDDTTRFQLQEIAFDPDNATDLMQRLMEDHALNVVVVEQKTVHLSEPMKLVEMLVLSGRLHHTGDKVLSFAMANTLAQEMFGGMIRPAKERGETNFAPKIDPVSALVTGMSRAMKGETAATPGILILRKP